MAKARAPSPPTLAGWGTSSGRSGSPGGPPRAPRPAPLAEQRRFQGTISVANVQAGRRLASREFLSCSSCHVGEEQPEGNPDEWAPDLRVAGRRLSPDWIVRWLQDPQRLSSGTKMPSFFADE